LLAVLVVVGFGLGVGVAVEEGAGLAWVLAVLAF
jgi:hypothetical protein